MLAFWRRLDIPVEAPRSRSVHIEAPCSERPVQACIRFRPILDGGVDEAEKHITSAYATLQQGRASIAYLSVMV